MELNVLNLSLSPAELHAIAFICSSDAWVQTFEPFLKGMERSALNDLLDPSEERRKEKSDEFLRAQVVIIRAFLAFPEYLIEEYNREIEAAEAAQEEKEHYEQRVAEGRYGPFGGAKPGEDNALL